MSYLLAPQRIFPVYIPVCCNVSFILEQNRQFGNVLISKPAVCYTNTECQDFCTQYWLKMLESFLFLFSDLCVQKNVIQNIRTNRDGAPLCWLIRAYKASTLAALANLLFTSKEAQTVLINVPSRLLQKSRTWLSCLPVSWHSTPVTFPTWARP